MLTSYYSKADFMLDIKRIDMYKSDKILSFSRAKKLIARLKSENKKVGLCHGGFDLLHPGHVKHFESAKKLCDILFVSITSDKFVSLRKGNGRPIYTDKLRAYMAASIKFVDYVVISNFETAIGVIKILKPDYYIKGSDYIRSTTQGIIAERKAIEYVGGGIKYTSEPKLATSAIIDYIKNKLKRESILMVLDRDGTLIDDEGFLGKNPDWKGKVKLKKEVIEFIAAIQRKYSTMKIVVSNQAGVARGYFGCKTVEEINKHIAGLLIKNGIKIDDWQYCPYVDFEYAKLNKEKINFNPEFIKEKTKRKPSPDMVYDALKALNKKLSDFSMIVVLGDKSEDKEMAKNINAEFIDSNHKTCKQMLKEFEADIQLKF